MTEIDLNINLSYQSDYKEISVCVSLWLSLWARARERKMGEVRAGGGGGCCPPMNLFRSEPMQLVQLIIPMESAHVTVSYLGDLGLLQFKDVRTLSLSLSLSLMALFNFAWWFSVWMNPSLIFAYVNSYNWAPISGDALLIDFWIDVIVIDWSRSEYLVWFALMLSEFWHELI